MRIAKSCLMALSLWAFSVTSFSGTHAGKASGLENTGVKTKGAEKTAIFAGGCFWCVEADFEKVQGVKEAISGFIGGKTPNPTYKGNHKDHYEAVKVIYDSGVVSYKELVDYFWRHIDPFDDKGQFCDKGESYLSAVFVATPEQKVIAQASRSKVQQQFPNQKIVTPILPVSTFYPIKGDESYHQDYYKKNPWRYKFYRYNCGRDQRTAAIWGKH